MSFLFVLTIYVGYFYHASASLAVSFPYLRIDSTIDASSAMNYATNHGRLLNYFPDSQGFYDVSQIYFFKRDPSLAWILVGCESSEESLIMSVSLQRDTTGNIIHDEVEVFLADSAAIVLQGLQNVHRFEFFVPVQDSFPEGYFPPAFWGIVFIKEMYGNGLLQRSVYGSSSHYDDMDTVSRDFLYHAIYGRGGLNFVPFDMGFANQGQLVLSDGNYRNYGLFLFVPIVPNYDTGFFDVQWSEGEYRYTSYTRISSFLWLPACLVHEHGSLVYAISGGAVVMAVDALGLPIEGSEMALWTDVAGSAPSWGLSLDALSNTWWSLSLMGSGNSRDQWTVLEWVPRDARVVVTVTSPSLVMHEPASAETATPVSFTLSLSEEPLYDVTINVSRLFQSQYSIDGPASFLVARAQWREVFSFVVTPRPDLYIEGTTAYPVELASFVESEDALWNASNPCHGQLLFATELVSLRTCSPHHTSSPT